LLACDGFRNTTNKHTMSTKSLSDTANAVDSEEQKQLARIADLERENTTLRDKLAGATELDKWIAEKMARGLTREQAEAVFRNQTAYDQAKKARGLE
jgi:hypothetical protein